MGSSVFNVALIGLGNIGMGYDLDLDDKEFVLSHARAFSQSPNFNLVLAVEKDPELREIFNKVYLVDAVEKIRDYNRVDEIDLVVVATSTQFHLPVIKEVLEVTRPLAVLCEKPLANNLADASAIIDVCEKENVSIFVNFIRRADPAVIKVKNLFAEGKLKPPFVGTVRYSKGLFNTASHFTDLVEFWFGAPVSYHSLSEAQPISLLNDVHMDFEVHFPDGHITFKSFPFEKIATHYLEFLFLNGRLTYTNDNRILWFKNMAGDKENRNQNIETEGFELLNEMKLYQQNIVCELYKAMKGLPHFLCSGQKALSWNHEFEKLFNNKGSC